MNASSTWSHVGVNVNTVATGTKMTSYLQHNLSGRVMWNDQHSVVAFRFLRWNHTRTAHYSMTHFCCSQLLLNSKERLSVTSCHNANVVMWWLAAVIRDVATQMQMQAVVSADKCGRKHTFNCRKGHASRKSWVSEHLSAAAGAGHRWQHASDYAHRILSDRRSEWVSV